MQLDQLPNLLRLIVTQDLQESGTFTAPRVTEQQRAIDSANQRQEMAAQLASIFTQASMGLEEQLKLPASDSRHQNAQDIRHLRAARMIDQASDESPLIQSMSLIGAPSTKTIVNGQLFDTTTLNNSRSAFRHKNNRLRKYKCAILSRRFSSDFVPPLLT